MVSHRWLTALVLGLLSLPAPALSRLEARLDSQTVHPGQSLLLSLEADADLPATALDLRPLTVDFLIGEPSISRRAGHTRWVLPLLPRHPGAKEVPALRLGKVYSAPLLLQPASTPSTTAQTVTLESRLSTTRVYEGEPLLYSIRTIYAAGVRLRSLRLQASATLRVRQLGEDELREEVRRGRRTTVLLRHYVLLPNRSGTLSLPGLLIEGEGPRPFLVQGPPLQLQVLPRPAEAGSDWRPAADLQVQEQWHPRTDAVIAGEPLFRTLTINASGLDLAGLPDLRLPSSPAWRSYVEGQQRREWQEQGQLRVEYRLREVLVPQQSTGLTLPAQPLPWWNSRLKRTTQAGLPARQLGGKVTATAILPPPAPGPGWVTAGLTLCLALIGLWRGRSRLTRRLEGSEALTWWRLRLALHRGRAPTIRRALLHWAARRWPEQPPAGLAQLPLPTLAVELEALLVACHGSTHAWSARPLQRALLEWRRRQAGSSPRLNPRGLI